MSRNKLEELKADILARGLLHAPVVRLVGDEPWLVAGERRLTAARELAAEGKGILFDRTQYTAGWIPCVTLADEGEIRNREAELNENLKREDLSWQDEVAAIDELHRLRQAQNPTQTKKDTAVEISAYSGVAQSTAQRAVDRAVIIAQHLDNPDVQRAGSTAEAFKIVSRQMEAEFRAQMMLHAPAGESAHRLFLGDCLALMSDQAPSTNYTCILVDPPYGIDADKFGNAAQFKHSYADTATGALAICTEIFNLGFKLTADQAHLYMFCDIEHFLSLRQHAEYHGWNVFRTPLIWGKGSQGHVPEGSTGWRRTYECILFASKGDKRLPSVVNDIIPVAPESVKLHAAQKPVELYKKLLAASCVPGDRVLDPCCGAGTIFKAAHELKLRATGIELDVQYHKYAQAALAGLNAAPIQLDLAAI